MPDIFDQVAARPAGDIFDQVAAPQSQGRMPQYRPGPMTRVSEALPPPDQIDQITTERAQSFAEAATRPQTMPAPEPQPGALDHIKSLPGMAYQLFKGNQKNQQQLDQQVKEATAQYKAEDVRAQQPIVNFDQMLPKTTGKGVIRGAAEFASGLTSPQNLALIGGTAGLAELAPTFAKLIGLGFRSTMLWDAVSRSSKFTKAAQEGDWATARQELTKIGLSATFAAAGGRAGMETDTAKPQVKRQAAAVEPEAKPQVTPERVTEKVQPIAASSPAVPRRSVPKEEVRPAPVAPKRTTLPHSLAGAKPRYSYGAKQFDLEFASDTDKAAYIAAQTKRSKADAQYTAFAMQATGMTEPEVRVHGVRVRAQIKAMAREAEPGKLTVPEFQRRTSAPLKAESAKPAPEEKPVPSEDETLLDAIAQSQLKKSFKRASPQEKATIRQLAGKLQVQEPGSEAQPISETKAQPQETKPAVSSPAPLLPENKSGAGSPGEPPAVEPIKSPEAAQPQPQVGQHQGSDVLGEPSQPKVETDPQPPPVDRESGGVYLGGGLGAFEPIFREAKAEGDRLRQSRNEALDAAKRAAGNSDEKHAGELIRHYYTEERDLWAGTANQQLEIVGRKVVPKIEDRSALSIAREFRHQPAQLQQFIEGVHPFLTEEPGRTGNLARQLPLLRQALRMITTGMTENERRADQVETALAQETLTEGLRVGNIGGSRWEPDVYVPHILNRKGEGDIAQLPSVRGRSVGKIGKFFGFGERRQDDYPTLVHAMADGIIPKTLDSTAAFTIHADTFARSRATRLLENHLAEIGLGKYTEPEFAPKGWERVAAHTDEFSKLIPFLRQIQPGEDAQQQIALAKINSMQMGTKYADLPMVQPTGTMVPDISRQHLFAPPFIVKALHPMTAPDFLAREIPGFAAVRSGQRELKRIILGLSGFHALTETDMAKVSMGPRAMYKALTTEREAPEALRNERDGIGHGLTTSISSKAIEAYRGLKPGTMPTRAQVVMAYTGGKQIMEAADAMTYTTFDNLQRRYKVWDYATQRDNWLNDNPHASPQQETQAKRAVASYVNGVYGGLHWENMGVPRAFLEVGRFFFLAPDWSGSNLALAKYAMDAPLSIHEFRPRSLGGHPLEGALTKKAVQARLARAFWTKQLMQGLIENQLMSRMLSGQWSSRPFQVYHGKDKDGKDVYQNSVFRGSAADLISFATKGPGVFIGSKAAPIMKAAIHQMTGRDDFGREIANKDLGFVPRRIREAATAVSDVSPIPIVARSIVRSVTGDDSDKYMWSERIMTLFGPPAQHVAPEGMESTPFGLREKPYRERADWWTRTWTNRPNVPQHETEGP